MLKPRGSRTFQDYSQQIFISYLLSQLESVDRVDTAWDTYLRDSLNQSTKESRVNSGTSQQRVLGNAPITPNWDSFLQIEQNKDEMFHSVSWLSAYDHVTSVEMFFLMHRMKMSPRRETTSWVTLIAFSRVLTRKRTLGYSYMLLIAQSVG
ncbi:hypothetical protein LSH36_201g00024 [Paralvinella palmiformis]|uniref:Uncharacterized protein n=1 Tax=Paralvinella palmiformis TaxID=53620 RepID=A0AAD9JPU5_9ANNE|nr:hypothetical protein LSH36_201g00024 [Paralvinella palmiformis]